VQGSYKTYLILGYQKTRSKVGKNSTQRKKEEENNEEVRKSGCNYSIRQTTCHNSWMDARESCLISTLLFMKSKPHSIITRRRRRGGRGGAGESSLSSLSAVLRRLSGVKQSFMQTLKGGCVGGKVLRHRDRRGEKGRGSPSGGGKNNSSVKCQTLKDKVTQSSLGKMHEVRGVRVTMGGKNVHVSLRRGEMQPKGAKGT